MTLLRKPSRPTIRIWPACAKIYLANKFIRYPICIFLITYLPRIRDEIALRSARVGPTCTGLTPAVYPPDPSLHHFLISSSYIPWILQLTNNHLILTQIFQIKSHFKTKTIPNIWVKRTYWIDKKTYDVLQAFYREIWTVEFRWLQSNLTFFERICLPQSILYLGFVKILIYTYLFSC